MKTNKLLFALSLLFVLIAASFTAAGALTPMHVSSFKAAYAAGHITTSVGVKDGMNRAISNATVQVSFEKDASPIILRSGLTGIFGSATLSAATSRGTWIVCVEEIHKLGYVYNPLQNLCTTVKVP